ncbi:hypothetical protein BT93_F2243 [Corymbia citriodora subsp. variegata]|nr:hypothetical protein BT93_F2243 [Corymbia citriodora subsp. variegata]
MEDWPGWGPCMGIGKLKVVHLSSCNRITKTPDFSSCLNLKRLIFEKCEHLAHVDGSINRLEHLKHLEITATLRLGPWARIHDCKPILPLSLPKSVGGLKSLLMLKIENKQLQELPPSIGDLVYLKYLSLSGCREFGKLPDSIGGLKSLLEMDLSSTGIANIPDSAGNLKTLKVMKLNACWKLRELPDSIGRLESLCKLEFSNTGIIELPDSIGNLKRLEVIHSSFGHMMRLPESIGALESLLMLIMDGGSIRELPDSIKNLKKLKCLTLGKNVNGVPNSIGMLQSLEELRVGCTAEEIPSEIGQLFSLRILDLSGSKFRRLPTTIGQLSRLEELILRGCNGLQQLPDLPKSLTKLEMSSSSLEIVPDLSNMTNLVYLEIVRGIYDVMSIYDVVIPRRQAQTPKDWLERFTLPPTNLSSLSRLRQLIITCLDPRSLTQLPSCLEELTLVDVGSPIEWSLFSALTKLSLLTIRGCQLTEILFDVTTGQLENLHLLQVEDSGSLERLTGLSSLKELQELSLNFCPRLAEIQGLGELEFLQALSIENCGSVQRLPDLSKLQKLEKLRIIHCESLQDLSDLPKTCSLWILECPEVYDGHFKGPYEFYQERRKNQPS